MVSLFFLRPLVLKQRAEGSKLSPHQKRKAKRGKAAPRVGLPRHPVFVPALTSSEWEQLVGGLPAHEQKALHQATFEHGLNAKQEIDLAIICLITILESAPTMPSANNVSNEILRIIDPLVTFAAKLQDECKSALEWRARNENPARAEAWSIIHSFESTARTSVFNDILTAVWKLSRAAVAEARSLESGNSPRVSDDRPVYIFIARVLDVLKGAGVKITLPQPFELSGEDGADIALTNTAYRMSYLLLRLAQKRTTGTAPIAREAIGKVLALKRRSFLECIVSARRLKRPLKY